MTLGDYLVGAVWFLATAGAAVTAATVAQRRCLGYLAGAARLLAVCLLATAAAIFAHVAPAAAGVLTRSSALMAAALVLAAALALPRPHEPRVETSPPAPRSKPLSVLAAAIAVSTLGAYQLWRLHTLGVAPLSEDMLNFHLPGVARFIQNGTIWRVDQFLPGFATGQYPNNGDFVLLSTVLPWKSIALVRYVGTAFFALSALAVYGLGRELGASRAAAVTFATAAVSVPAYSELAIDGLPDAIMVFALVTGVLFVLRHAHSQRRADLALGGIGLGIALGTKWHGFTSVVVIVVAWIIVWVVLRRPLRRLAGEAALLVATVLIGGGIWLLRNLIESGNPLYPKQVAAVGVQIFQGSRHDELDRFGYTIVHYISHLSILRRYVYPGFKLELGVAGLAIAAGVVAAAALGASTVRQAPRRAVPEHALLYGAVVIAVLALVYAITPGSAYGPLNQPVEAFTTVRWLMPAVALGAALAAGAAARLSWASIGLELVALYGVFDSVGNRAHVPGLPAKAAVALLVLALAALAVRKVRARDTRTSGPALAMLGAVGLAGVVALGLANQRSFERHTYAPYDPVFAWLQTYAPSHRRIGVAGIWLGDGLPPVLPAFGPRLGNRVTYVGPFRRHTVVGYQGPLPYTAALHRGRYDLVLVGREHPAGVPAGIEGWTAAAGYRLVAESPRFALFSAPPSAPAQCSFAAGCRAEALLPWPRAGAAHPKPAPGGRSGWI